MLWTPGKRIAIVGTTGSGKTTLAQQLAQRLGLEHIELDALYWGPGWQPAPEFRVRVAAATAGTGWVVDGNYREVRDIVWGRADTLIWLDYSLPMVFWQLVRRTFRRAWFRQELWNGNREDWRGAFFSRDSLLLYVFKSRHKQRRAYPDLLQQPEYAHLAVLHFHTQRDATRWLAALSSSLPSQV